MQYPAWWDLAAAAALVAGATDVQTGQWVLDDDVPGQLVRTGDGDVRVVRSLDGPVLEPEYEKAFG